MLQYNSWAFIVLTRSFPVQFLIAYYVNYSLAVIFNDVYMRCPYLYPKKVLGVCCYKCLHVTAWSMNYLHGLGLLMSNTSGVLLRFLDIRYTKNPTEAFYALLTSRCAGVTFQSSPIQDVPHTTTFHLQCYRNSNSSLFQRFYTCMYWRGGGVVSFVGSLFRPNVINNKLIKCFLSFFLVKQIFLPIIVNNLNQFLIR